MAVACPRDKRKDKQTTKQTKIDRRIARGIKWLDKNAPGWLERVHRDMQADGQFDIENDAHCVLANAFETSYFTALRRVSRDEDDLWAMQHAFMPTEFVSDILPSYAPQSQGSRERRFASLTNERWIVAVDKLWKERHAA